MRAWWLRAVVGVVLIAVVLLAVGIVRVEARQHSMGDRAVATASAMLNEFYNSGQGLLTTTQGENGSGSSIFSEVSFTPTDMWDYSWALDGLEEVALLPGGSRFLPQIKTLVAHMDEYWDAQAPVPGYSPAVHGGPNTTKYFDDNAWAGLDLIYAYRLTKDPQDLTQAEAVFRYEESGWDPNGGGLFWSDARQYRNTPANGPATELAVYLYLDTHQVTYLQWAEKIYKWEVSTLVNPSTGEVYDGIDNGGSVNHALYTYNQGTVIGAATLLYEVTHKQSYLNQARQTFYFTDNSSSLVQSDGVLVDQAEFNGVLADNLVLLYRVDPDPTIAKLIDTSASMAWSTARDPQTGMIAANWNGPPPTSPQSLLTESGAVRILAAAAAIHGPVSTWDALVRKPQPCHPAAKQVVSLFAATGQCTD